MKVKVYDAIIVGMGASGLACAITLKKNKPNASILVVEKKDKAALKVIASGNGRCNVTNENAENYEVVRAFLDENGIMTRTLEEGRVYPYSEDSKAIVNTLAKKIPSEDVRYNTTIKAIERSNGVFKLSYATVEEKSSMTTVGFLWADNVVIATGGKSYPGFGTTGDGYVFARKLGHTVSTLIPGLTAICVAKKIAELKGVRAKGVATLLKDGIAIAREEGEIQFREDSLSGIAIMNLSNLVKGKEKYEIVLDLAPGLNDISNYELETIVKPQLATYIKRMRQSVHAVKFEVAGLKGWQEAQITCGGVATDELKPSCESKVAPGVYITGEVQDYQAKCGGYNLNNAWYTGICAGLDIANKEI